jgi:hypothetical protein
MICRITGSLQKASVESPMELSHLTGRLWRTMVESDETLDDIDDLLTLGSSNFWVSESALFVVLDRALKLTS